MLVVSDIEDVYLPKPNDLLVNLTEAKASLETLLTRLNTMFADNLSVGSALGAALQAAFKMIVRIRLLSASLLVSHAFHL
jgi:protein transport protein SEC24